MKTKTKNILEGSQMPLQEFLEFAISVSSGLDELHKNDSIHGDLRLGNISWEPKKLKAAIIASSNENSESSIFSTERLPYISPEQTGRMNRKIDYRTDFYSLGIIFYQRLTGRLPFISEDTLEMIHCHIAKIPVEPHELRSEIPEQISAIVMRMLKKNAEDRYHSASGFQYDLQKCANLLSTTGKIKPFKIGESDFTGVFLIPQKLYGREKEIKILLDSFDRISAGATELMLVAGYSGIGKTALVHEVQKPLAKKRGYFIEGKFDQYQRNIPYSGWSQAFDLLMNHMLMESEGKLDIWKTKILEAVSPNGKVLTDVIPNLEKIIGPQPAVQELSGQEAQNRFNIVFQNFIKVMAQKEHPLVIFLDDLQWSDSASLSLLHVLLTDTDLTHFLIIGAYRDNEVNDLHPFTISMKELQQSKVNMESIILKNLSKEDINALCTDALHCALSESRSLSQLVYSKTSGNPFFTHQLLHTLNNEKLIDFDVKTVRWHWDIEVLKAIEITDNIVDLLSSKIQKLPYENQEVLKLAACIGSQFDLPILAIIAQNSVDTINSNLQSALKQKILFKVTNGYKFVHDRVQQAAYELIPESEKKSTHLQIGRLLQQHLSEQEQQEQIFDIVNHLNNAVDLISDSQERVQLANLNLKASSKTKATSAFWDAKKYIEIGIKLLGSDSWQERYMLTLALYNENGELSVLTGQFDQVSKTADLIHANARSILDQIPIYMVRIEVETSKSQLAKALKIGLKVLKELGIEIPKQPGEEDYQRLTDRFVSLLSSRSIEHWGELPLMTDKTALAASAILAAEMSTAYAGNPSLYPIFALKSAILSLEFGLNTWSPFFFGNVGLLTVASISIGTNTSVAFEKIQFAGEVYRMTCEMMENPVTAGSRSKSLNTLIIISPWIEPIEKGIELSKASFRSGYEQGDFLYSSYATYLFAVQAFASGMNLEAYQSQLSNHTDGLVRLGQKTGYYWVMIYQQTAQNFKETSLEPDRLKGSYFDEEEWLPGALAENDVTSLHNLSINKLILVYHFDLDDKLDEHVRKAEGLLIGGPAMFSMVLFYLYFALSKLRLVGEINTKDHAETINLVDSYLQLLGVWSISVPTSFQHMYDLISAEKARVTGDLDGALSHYEQAISGAHANGFTQEEALANELYARFWIERNNARFASPLLIEAHRLYNKWGAKAKAEHLYKRYPEWITEADVATADKAKTSTKDISKNLDLQSIFKASQELAGEIELQSLLTKMMGIVIENAGAQKGFLIMEKEGKWLIEAEGDVTKNEVTVLQSVNIDTSDSISVGIVNYVVNSHTHVVLNDATHEGNYTGDPVIQQLQSKSILCTPLINQTKVVGVLYLENNLTIGAFTPERMELLNLLSSQIAISLDKTKLYSKLKISEERFRATFEQAAIGIAHVSPDGRFLRINEKFCEIVGYSYEELQTTTFQKITYPDDLDADIKQIKFLLTGEKESYAMEKRYFHKKGQIVWVNLTVSLVKDQFGNPLYFVSVVENIDSRKKMEAAIVTGELNFRSVFESSPIAKLIVDDHGLIIQGNHEAEKTFGYSTNELMGKPIEMLMPKQLRSIHKEHRKQFYKRPEPRTMGKGLDLFALHKDGREFPVEIALKPMELEGEKVVLTVINDISERKRAEEAIQKSEKRFRATFEQAAVGIAHVSPDGKFLRINSKFCEFLGYNQEEMLTRDFQTITHPEDLEKDIINVQGLLKGEANVYSIEKRYIRKDGNVIWANLTVSLLRKETSEPDYFISVVEEITDKKNAEFKIIEHQQRLRDLAHDLTISEETIRKQIAADLHDHVGQMLSSIRMQLSPIINLEENPDLITRMTTISQALLIAIRATRSAIFDLSPPQLNEIGLYAAVHDWAKEEMEHKNNIITTITGEHELIGLEENTRVLMFRSIKELCINVLKHARANRLKIEFKKGKKALEISVEDDGVGFSFDTKQINLKSDSYGLFSIQERLSDLGGEMTVNSISDRGTKIKLTIPLKSGIYEN